MGLYYPKTKSLRYILTCLFDCLYPKTYFKNLALEIFDLIFLGGNPPIKTGKSATKIVS